MYCTSCQYFKETCTKVQIYASGYIYECPFYGTPEPVISSTGCNFQVMGETISSPNRPEYVELKPIRAPDYKTWFTKIMICYEGHGTIISTKEEITLAGVAIWIGWQNALIKIKELNKTQLNHLIPLIEERIKFNHSSIRYGSLLKPPYMKLGVSKAEPLTKPKKIIIPEDTDHLMDVVIPENTDKPVGDQMDLFAL